jgi:two-component system, LytTR family, response regulator
MHDKMSVAIVDDEPLARARLNALLAKESDIDIVAECEDGYEAIEAIAALKPKLVFLDIQMPEVNGFDVLAAVGADEFPEVVFVTGYDEFAVHAFEASAVDYLMKPFENQRFSTALNRARKRVGQSNLEQRLSEILERYTQAHLDRFVVRCGSKYEFIPVHDVDYLQTAGNYIELHFGGKTRQLRSSMAALETRLHRREFVRIHRSTIVNVARIAMIEPWNQTEFVLKLLDGTKLTSSRAYRDRVCAILER